MRLWAASALIVPLCSIVGHEVWQLTANLRYRVSPADPTRTMRALVYDSHGPARTVARVVETAQPLQPAAPGMLVVSVVAAALNPVDFKMMRNPQPSALIPKPKTVGYDVAGHVLSAGEGSGFAVGEAVYGMLPLVGNPWGSLAEVAVADASCFARAPTSVPLADAAALPLVGLTVMQVALAQLNLYGSNFT